jgi:para-nitrobenzyl esterase
MTEPVANTTSGPVLGAERDRVLLFRGVPYGASTGGERRFLPPAPPAPWTEIRECLRYGLPSPQPAGGMGVPLPAEMAAAMGIGRPMPMGEECLVLNVWSPGLDDAKRPVMVWLHGGGFTSGSGANPVTSGEQLARRGDVVVVTVNHRLGALGFLHLAELDGPELAASGMNGILDIQAALGWVRDNIAGFGGDPENVTIFGESGGGMKVTTLLAMPSARGLFHRAIVQSGPYLRATPPERAAKATAALMSELGASTLGDLRAVPMERIVEAQVAVGREGHGFGPVVDGSVLPRDPYTPAAPATAAGIPLLIGTNRDEMTLFMSGRTGYGSWSDADALRQLASLGVAGATVYDRYRELHPEWTPTQLAVAVSSDGSFRTGSITQAERHLASGAPAWLYLFAWESPMAGGTLKAAHSVEVSLVFDNLARDPSASVDDKAQLVADAMSEAWLAFARNGDPNHPEIPPWPAYDAEDRPTMVFNHRSTLEHDPLGAERRAWDGLEAKPLV